MKKTIHAPRSLLDAIKYFSDPDVAITFVAGLRWAFIFMGSMLAVAGAICVFRGERAKSAAPSSGPDAATEAVSRTSSQ